MQFKIPQNITLEELTERLVICAILMESHGGIIEKAPHYILEKFKTCMESPYPENGLDFQNRRKFEEWRKKWW